MMIMFKRLFFLRTALSSLAYALRRYPSLLLGGLPAFIIFLCYIVCREKILSSAPPVYGDLPYMFIIGLVVLNFVSIICVSQMMTVWSRISDARFDNVPLGVLVSVSFKEFWKMALPLFPVWIIMSSLLYFILTIFFSAYKLFSLSGQTAAMIGLAWMLVIIWPLLTVLTAKLLFLPTFALETPKPNFFTGIIASWNYVTMNVLKHHWLAFLILTFPVILGVLLPFALMQENLLYLVKGKNALLIQEAGAMILWLIGPIGVAAAQRLNMILVSEFNKEIRRLASNQNQD
ncbi:hypothetical protein IKS38_01560 [bacterium]|nr:hypothetical protein [bacterium]